MSVHECDAERLHKKVEARPDKDRYQAALGGTTAVNEQYDRCFTELCATVPETTVDAATTQKFTTCSGLYTSIITGASDLQDKLRPSE